MICRDEAVPRLTFIQKNCDVPYYALDEALPRLYKIPKKSSFHREGTKGKKAYYGRLYSKTN